MKIAQPYDKRFSARMRQMLTRAEAEAMLKKHAKEMAILAQARRVDETDERLAA